jgi:uncharacterized membrane protein YeaQ/YmgE (transglycosylase-associated protein family)
MLWTLIVTVIGGLIIGLLGKWVAPGDRDNIPLWLTIVCGIVGMLVGSFVYWGLFGSNNGSFDGHEATMNNATNGVDWMRHLWQVAVAALAVMAAAFITGRTKTRV